MSSVDDKTPRCEQLFSLPKDVTTKKKNRTHLTDTQLLGGKHAKRQWNIILNDYSGKMHCQMSH